MTRVARETGLVTQMGNNGHAGEGLRLTREWLQAGAIGPVREIHCWSDRPGKWWTQNHDRPAETPPVPAVARLGPLDRRRADAAVLASSITPTTGGAGSTSAPGRWATWPSTTWTRPSTPSTSAPRRPSRRRPAR